MTLPKSPAPNGTLTATWFFGLVVGVASGFLVVEFGVVGLSFLALSVGFISWKRSRLLALGGLLVGFGALWTFLFGRVQLTCGADAFFPDPGCSSVDLTPWIAGSAATLVSGLLLSAVSLRRAR